MLRKLTLAASLAVSGFAMNANAVDFELFLGGATALDTATRRLIVIDVCQSNIEKYQNTAIGFTYRCTPRAGLAGINPATDRVIISKNTVAGSFTGVREVRNQTTLVKPPSPVNLGTSGCGALAATTEFGIAIQAATCTGNAGTGIPDAGFSDVEPAIFNSLFTVTPVSPAPFGPSWQNGLASVGAFAQGFGLPVNDKTYRVLQIAQGKCASVAACQAADPSFGEALAPSLNIGDVRGMLGGTLLSWDGIDANRTTGVSAIATAASASGLDLAVKVCRRGDTSGTNATYRALCQGAPCLGGSALPFFNNGQDNCTVNGTGGTTGTGIGNGGYIGDGTYPNVTVDQCRGNYTVVVNNGSSNVDTCLTKADDLNEMAIGNLGLDRIPGDVGSGTGDDPDGATDRWHFVKFNDVYPSIANINSCKYELVVESTFNRRSAGNGAAYGTAKTSLMDRIQNASADPANPLPGVYSLPSRGFDFTGAPTSQIIKCERGGNTCGPLVTSF